MLFAKTPASIEYYTQATAEGSFVVITSEKLKVETFDANSGKTYITLMMDNARLESAHFDSNRAPMQAQQAAPQQQAPQSWGNPPPQQPQQQAAPEWNPNQPPF